MMRGSENFKTVVSCVGRLRDWVSLNRPFSAAPIEGEDSIVSTKMDMSGVANMLSDRWEVDVLKAVEEKMAFRVDLMENSDEMVRAIKLMLGSYTGIKQEAATLLLKKSAYSSPVIIWLSAVSSKMNDWPARHPITGMFVEDISSHFEWYVALPIRKEQSTMASVAEKSHCYWARADAVVKSSVAHWAAFCHAVADVRGMQDTMRSAFNEVQQLPTERSRVRAKADLLSRTSVPGGCPCS